MREAAPVRDACKYFSIAEHRLRLWIKAGLITPRAVGRRSVILFDELREVIRSCPPTKSSRRTINERRSNEHASES